MLIEIHAIQNHSPANLNRDDIGAPKTCYFGGVLRSRISSQCIKRSIRMSKEFKELLGGVRTRQLAELITNKVTGKADVADVKELVVEILGICGIMSKGDGRSEMLVYTTKEAIDKMAGLLSDNYNVLKREFDGYKASKEKPKEKPKKIRDFGEIIAEIIARKTAAPDMALSGRMLETGVLQNTTVEAALQVAHAISTHKAHPEVDYYVAVDDVRGEDAGAGHVGEAMFASACFYKYFSINWETLVENLGGNKELAAHTVGAFIRGAALVNPTGKQNSFAAHNPPDGMLIEIRNELISYANAFAKPVNQSDQGDIISQSIAQLGQYIHDIDKGYGKPTQRFWFSPNLRYPYPLKAVENKEDIKSLKSLCELTSAVVEKIGYNWEEVKKVVVNSGMA